MAQVFKVIVTHSLGLKSDYDIEAMDYQDAELIAKSKFINDFCGGTLSTWFRGVEEKHTVSCFTIDKLKYSK